MKLHEHLKEGKWLDLTIALVIAVLVYLGVSHIYLLGTGIKTLLHWLYPVTIGLIFAYISDPLTKFFERCLKKIGMRETARRRTAVILTLLVIIGCFVLLVVALIPALIESTTMFLDNFDGYAASLKNLINSMNIGNTQIASLLTKGETFLDNLFSIVLNSAGDIAKTTIDLGKNIFTWILGLILAIYFLFDKKRLIGGLDNLLEMIIPETPYAKTKNFLATCHNILVRYIVSDIIDGLIVGCANAIFMLITGMPYVLIISVVVGVTNLAPTFGPILGGVIGGVILLFVNPMQAVIFVIFTVILQTIDGYVIKPKLFGSTLGVPSVWVLIFIIVGARIFGIGGVLLGIPFAAIFNFVYHNLIRVRLQAIREKRRRAKENNDDDMSEKKDLTDSPAYGSSEVSETDEKTE